jgi:hypothetical protein
MSKFSACNCAMLRLEEKTGHLHVYVKLRSTSSIKPSYYFMKLVQKHQFGKNIVTNLQTFKAIFKVIFFPLISHVYKKQQEIYKQEKTGHLHVYVKLRSTSSL